MPDRDSLSGIHRENCAVSEFQQRSIDRELMELAWTEGRILITEDKDFGWLAFIANKNNPGIILIRFPAPARRSLADSVKWLVVEFGDKLMGAFVVPRLGWVRISAAPDDV